MGSFDVACSVSRITINVGDPVAYFPLQPSKYAYEIEAANNMLIYPWCYYVPVCLPIFGEYDDYGCIRDIKENNSKASIEAIEKYFKTSIKNVCNGNPLPCSGMFVHREIYQTLVDNQIDQWGGTELKDDDGYGKPSKKLLGKRFDELRKILRERRNIPKHAPRNSTGLDTIMRDAKIGHADYAIHEAEQKFGYSESEAFHQIYNPYIRRGWFKKQIIEFLYFNYSLNYANVHFFPAQNGYQWGNHYGNIIVHQKAVEILKKKIEEDEKLRDEDE